MVDEGPSLPWNRTIVFLAPGLSKYVPASVFPSAVGIFNSVADLFWASKILLDACSAGLDCRKMDFLTGLFIKPPSVLPAQSDNVFFGFRVFGDFTFGDAAFGVFTDFCFEEMVWNFLLVIMLEGDEWRISRVLISNINSVIREEKLKCSILINKVEVFEVFEVFEG